MSKPLIIVTGKNGQLGWELEQLSAKYENTFRFLFTDKYELDLGTPLAIPSFFEKYSPAYFINCAAYTAVDKAETEQETAFVINAESVGVIAQQCRQHDCTLITISTDYVFDGKADEPYQPGTKTNPVNYYGYTKWMGEKLALENNERTLIIRTSWVYSTHGNNFVKTMLRLMKERTELKVVSDQVGSPTYAADLADAIMQMIVSLEKGNTKYGIYHYSNEGVISWYDFAIAIRNISGSSCEVLPQPASAYPTPAKRPAYSVMDTSAIVRDFGISLANWEKSLTNCLAKLS
ncbi:MAG: dTDP-4-dehydrorhamnose reductase [Bacteroidota bacterium]